MRKGVVVCVGGEEFAFMHSESFFFCVKYPESEEGVE
jgi:hypothetical protein